MPLFLFLFLYFCLYISTCPSVLVCPPVCLCWSGVFLSYLDKLSSPEALFCFSSLTIISRSIVLFLFLDYHLFSVFFLLLLFSFFSSVYVHTWFISCTFVRWLSTRITLRYLSVSASYCHVKHNFRLHMAEFCVLKRVWLTVAPMLHRSRVQELCESRGGRPGLPVLMSLIVFMDIKQQWTMHTHWWQFAPNMSAWHPSSTSSSSLHWCCIHGGLCADFMTFKTESPPWCTTSTAILKRVLRVARSVKNKLTSIATG